MRKARTQRRSAVRDLLKKVFSAAVEQLGPDEAHRIWIKIPQIPGRKRGRPPKEEISGFDALLLFLYDELLPDQPDIKSLPRWIANTFEESQCTPNSTERRLRRLLKDRKEGRLVPIEFGKPLRKYKRGRLPPDKK